jgi:hypothetical protein
MDTTAAVVRREPLATYGHHSLNYRCASNNRRTSELALQQRLGILSIWRAGFGVVDHHNPARSQIYLTSQLR